MSDPTDDFDSFVTPARPRKQREYRTDRNNNPIAAAVTTGGRNQFTDALDAAKIPWEHGDPFPNNPKLSTIRIKGDPYEGARAILSNSNALKWYRGTTGKQVLPKYGVRSNADFAKLPIDHQNDIINGIYQSEGGSGAIKPTQDDFDKYVSAAEQSKEGDDFDQFVTQESQPKTPQVTSSIKELDSQQEIPAGALPPVAAKPIAFQPAGRTAPRTLNPVETLYEATDEKEIAPKGLARLQSREYQAPASREVGERIKLQFPHGAPTEDDVVNAYLSTLGPEYAQLGERYKAETGHNILTVAGNVKQEDDGSFSIRPSRGAVDFINAYAKGGLNEALPLAERQRRDYIKAQEDARLRAQPAVERARRAVEAEKQSPVSRGILTSGAGPMQAGGTVLGPAGSGVRDFADELRAVGEQAESEKPLKSLSKTELAEYGAGALIPTAATLALTRQLGPAQLPALGVLQGQTPAERIKGGLEGTAMQAALGPIPSQLGESLPSVARKGVAGPTLAAIPTAQAIHGGEPVTSALIQNAPFALMPMLEKGGGPERPTELGIQRAETAGVPGEATANIDQRLAERESRVQPTFLRDDQGKPVARVLNPDEVAEGGKPKVRAIHHSDTEARDESGKFTVSTTPPTEIVPPSEVAQPATSEPLREPPSALPAGAVSEATPQPTEGVPVPEAKPRTMDLADWRKGGYVEVPVTYVRFGELPEGKSGKFMGGKRVGEESGVSVYEAWKDPKTGKYVIRAPGDEDIATLEGMSGSKRKIYEVSGRETGRGGDEEPLLEVGSGRVIREITPDEIVTDSEPRITYAGRELSGEEIPDWTVARNDVIGNMPGASVQSGGGGTTAQIKPEAAQPVRAETTAAAPRNSTTDLQWAQRTAQAFGGNVTPEGSGYRVKLQGYDRVLPDIDSAVKYIRDTTDGLEATGTVKPDYSKVAPVKSAKPPEQISESAPVKPPISVEQNAPPASAESPVPPEPSTTSARKAQLAADRAELELPELPAPERKGWRTSLINAKEKGLDQKAERLADQVLRNPRALDDEQTAGMTLRLQQLKNEHSTLLKEIGDGDFSGEKRAELEAVENSFDKISEAVKKSGTEKGRALASQKLTINQDYDLISMLNRYKAKVGKEPSPEIRAEIEGYQKRIAELEKEAADREIQPTVQKMQREARRERRQVTKKVLDEEAATIKQNIAAEFQRLKSQQSNIQSTWGLGNLDPEGVITREALKYVRNRVEVGITDTAQLVDDVHSVLSEFVDGVTKRQVAEMISGYGRPPQQTRSELQKQIDDLKVQMRQELRDADVEAGIRPSGRPQGPKLSEGTQREGPRKSEARQSGQPLAGPKLSEGVASREGPKLGEKQGPQLREGTRTEGPQLGPKQGPRQSDVRKVKAEGPSLGPKLGPRQTRKAIETRYNKQIQELERRIREEDFGPRPKRGPTVPDADTRKLQVQVERAKQDYQRALRRWQDSQRSPAEKTADLIVNWARAAKLSYVSTLGKLTGAATGRMVMSPLENLIGEIPHRLAPELSQKATTEGGGFNKAAEVAALWKSGRFRQVLDQLTQGGSDLDVLFGPQGKMIDKEMRSEGVLGVPGRVHGALKEYPRQAEFDRARLKVLQAYERQGRDVTRPDVQLAANMEAFNSAERARFQQRNFISDGFNDLMRRWESRGGGAKAAAKVGKFLFPITRVPVNVVGETLNYTFGLPRAAAEHAWRKWRGTMNNLTPEQADSLVRAYKKGGIGLVVMAYAFLHPDQFGGYYQPHDKRKEGEPKPGEIKFLGVTIPKWATHIPILEAAQLAATSRRVMDKLLEKGSSKTDAALAGAGAGGLGLAKQIPFYETPARFAEGAGGAGEAGKRWLGQQVKGMIPGFVQEAARAGDKNEAGDTVPRKRTGFVEEIQEGIPYLRKKLPESKTEKANFKDRLLTGMRKGESPDLDSLVSSERLTEAEKGQLEREAEMTPYQVTFDRARPDEALARYERLVRTNDPRKYEVEELMSAKAYSLLNSKALTESQRKDFQERIDRLGIDVKSPSRSNNFIPSFRTRFVGARP